LPDLAEFYGSRLGLPVAEADEVLVVSLADSQLAFRQSPAADPFYHFAILVPGNRFDAASEWLAERAELLADPQTGEKRFDFSAWDAYACYCHDPAGNIVELISLAGIGEGAAREGGFSADELLEIAEIGFVGHETAEMAAALAGLDIEIWDGTVDEPGRLAFAGERGRSIILSPTGRGWLPTGRPAEVHPADIVVAAAGRRQVTLPRVPYTVREAAG
jgi:hypothetical protein